MNTPSGVFDLSTGDKKNHDPKLYLSHLTSISPDEDTPTPHFDRFLHKITEGDKDYRTYLKLRFGSMLHASNPENIAVLAHGRRGGSGKSTLFNTLSKILGSYFGHASADTFMLRKRGENRDDLVKLSGSRMIVAGEPSDGALLDTATFKIMTGGDTITAAAKYEKTRNITPTWKILIHTNSWPILTSPGNPIWRRMEVAPFRHDFLKDPEYDPQIESKLILEGPGILWWLLQGCRLWVENRFSVGTLPQAVRDAVNEYKDFADPVRSWVLEWIEESSEASPKAVDLYEHFKYWTRSVGRRTPSLETFLDRLREVIPDVGYQAKFVRDPDTSVRHIKGVSLKNPRECLN